MAFFSLFSDFVASFIPSLLYCSHATLGLYKKVFHCAPKALQRWDQECLSLPLSLPLLSAVSFCQICCHKDESKHNFIEKSLSLCFLFFFPTIFSSFFKITKWFLPWILVGRKDGRCAHKSRWSQNSTVSKRCFSYRFSYIALLCDPDDVHPLEIKPKSA